MLVHPVHPVFEIKFYLQYCSWDCALETQKMANEIAIKKVGEIREAILSTSDRYRDVYQIDSIDLRIFGFI